MCNISNKTNCFIPNFQTQRRELQATCSVKYLPHTLRCLECGKCGKKHFRMLEESIFLTNSSFLSVWYVIQYIYQLVVFLRRSFIDDFESVVAKCVGRCTILTRPFCDKHMTLIFYAQRYRKHWRISRTRRQVAPRVWQLKFWEKIFERN